MGTPPFKVKAVFDYSSPHDDDLSFSNGQIVLVTDEEDADWYYGEYQDSSGKKQEGLFPKNFVEKYEPETPPRPSRPTRPKKDIEQAQGPSNPPDTDIPVEDAAPSAQATNSPPSKPKVQESATSDGPKVEEPQPMSPPPTLPNPSAAPPLSSSVKGVDKPGTPMASKAAPPAVAEKPSGGSFRDRIAAFNKPAAPVAPIKPSGLGQPGASGFVKKPFVAPPPSKNAYVPPPREPPPSKVYRREEDPEIALAVTNDQARPGLPMASTTSVSVDADPEDQPKPTSLKERIALLQKQQMEQAARHIEGGQKKEKPKRPPKKRTESHQSEKNLEGGTSTQQVESLERKSTEDDTPSHGPPPRARSSTRRRKSKEVTPATSPNVTSQEMFSDANDADQSGAGDTEEGDVSTGKDDDEKLHRRTSVLPPRTPKANLDQSSAGKDDDANKQKSEEEGVGEDDEEEEEEEEDIDPEVRRRMEIRERMAKMSGGMGMAGMFGPPPGVPSIASKKQLSGGSKPRDSEIGNDTPIGGPSSSRGVPLMGLPGMQTVRSPEQEHPPVEVSKEQMSTPTSLTQDHEPEDIPDIEDTEEEPRPTTGRPEERAVPLPPLESSRGETFRSKIGGRQILTSSSSAFTPYASVSSCSSSNTE